MNIGKIRLEIYQIERKSLRYRSKMGEFYFKVSREHPHGFPVAPGTIPQHIDLKVWVDEEVETQ